MVTITKAVIVSFIDPCVWKAWDDDEDSWEFSYDKGEGIAVSRWGLIEKRFTMPDGYCGVISLQTFCEQADIELMVNDGQLISYTASYWATCNGGN